MEEELSLPQAIGGLIGGVIGFVIGVLAPVYLWMLIFVDWLKYDYVTSSSVFFILSLSGGVFAILPGFIQPHSATQRVVNLLVWLLAYPILVVHGLKIYEDGHHPVVSNATNVIAMYRAVVIHPLSQVGGDVASLAPLPRRLYDAVNTSPLLTQIVGSSIVGGVAWLFGARSRPGVRDA